MTNRIQSDTASGNSAMPTWVFGGGGALLTIVYLCCSLTSIGKLPLLDPDEPRYAGAARTMAEGGSLLVPEFNGVPRVNKPPLFYWLVALSDTLAGGATETSSRTVSVVFGLLMLWGTIALGRRIFDPTTGLIGGAILATNLLFVALSRLCITDMTLSTLLAGALGILMLGLMGRISSKRALWIASILFGLAVLTKATAALGALLFVLVIDRAMALPKENRPAVARWIPAALLVAIVLSAAAIQCDAQSRAIAAKKNAQVAAQSPTERSAQASTQKPTPSETKVATTHSKATPAPASNGWARADSIVNRFAVILVCCVVGLLLFMAYRAESMAPIYSRGWTLALLVSIFMGLWWYLYLIYSQGLHRFQELLDFELRQRILGAMHRQGMHFYLVIIPVLTFPWAIGLIGALVTAWRQRGTVGTLGADDAASGDDGPRADRFLIAWIAGFILFFSIPGAKLETYVLGAMPAIAMLIARFLMRLRAPESNVETIWRRVTMGLAILMGIALLLSPVIVPLTAKNSGDLEGISTTLLWTFAAVGSIFIPAGWVLALKGRPRASAGMLSVTTLVLLALAGPIALDRLSVRSSKRVVEQSAESIRGCTRIAALGIAPESLSYYLKQRVDDVHWRQPVDNETRLDVLSELVGRNEPSALFVDRRSLPKIFGKDAGVGGTNNDKFKSFLPPHLVAVYADQTVVIIRNVNK